MKRSAVFIGMLLVFATVAPPALFAETAEESALKRGQAYLSQRAYDRAITEFTAALKENSANPRTYFFRGYARFGKGDVERALTDLDKAVSIDPYVPEFYNVRGAVLASRRLLRRAIADYTKAIELEPKAAAAYNNRGLAYRDAGDLEKSLADITKAIELSPTYAVAYRNRAYTYYLLKQNDLGRRDAAKAKELGLEVPTDLMAALGGAPAGASFVDQDLADGIRWLYDNLRLCSIDLTKTGGRMAIGSLIGIIIVVLFFAGIRIVRPTHRALIERLGKYRKFANPGFHWIIPIIDCMYQVNVTEQMVDAEPQEIITNDNLNARVDAQVYFKVKAAEEDVKNCQYSVNNYRYQVVNLARTTLRNIIGTLTLKSANSERGKINAELHKTLCEETKSWGLEIVRTELKEIDPPKDVQETMNKVVKAENEKIAAVDFATATETAADGARRAEIKKAEGIRQAKILAAQGEAEAIALVNEAAEKYFIGNAQVLRKLEAVETALKNNAKIVVPAGSELVNVIGEMAGIAPVPVKTGK